MMRLYIEIGLALAILCAPVGASTQSVITGEWMAEFRPDTGTAHLMIHRRVGAGGSDKRYFRLPLYRLEGLAQRLPVQDGSSLRVQLRREAGTFLFEGTFRDGSGSGNYTYKADHAFAAEMKKLGYDHISPEDQFMMAVHDIGPSLFASLKSLKGVSPSLDELISIGRQGISSDYFRELKAVDVEPKSLNEVIEMKLFGVTPEFIKAIESQGYCGLSINQLTCLRIQGITIDFITRTKDKEQRKLSLRELVRLRNPNGMSKGSCELETFPDKLPD